MHERRITSVTAAAEKRLLVWLASRLPPWVTPDMLTALGVAGAALVLVGFLLSNLTPVALALVPLGLVVNWFGDSLDGSLARVRGTQRDRYGGFLDQSADIISTSLMVAGLGLSPYVRFDVAMLTLAVYFALAVMVHARATATRIYDIAPGGISPTEGRLVMILIVVAMAATGPAMAMSQPFELGVYDIVYLAQCFWGAATFLVESWRTIRQLDREDPPRGA